MNNIRELVPPKLDAAHLGERIICYRPRRHGSPNMQVESIGPKLIAHNYGHGGSGWTIGPGTVKHVNNQFLHQAMLKKIRNDSLITIIGAGIIGLFTAYDLYQRGYENLIIISDKFADLTSHNAGGLISISTMLNHDHVRSIIGECALDSYKFYASIIDNNHVLQDCVKILPLYCDTNTRNGLEFYVGKVMRPPKEVVLDFGNGALRTAVAFDDAMLVYTVKIMQELSKYLYANGVKFIEHTVSDFTEVSSQFIFNCTGLGAGQLNNDESLVPVQGHLIRLKNQNLEQLNYMIDVDFGQHHTQNGQQVNRAFYFFPKIIPGNAPNDIGVLGGTFIPNATPETPNLEEFDLLLHNASQYCGL